MIGKKTQDDMPGAEILDWASRNDDIRYIRHYAKSVELIRASFERGMSRNAMRKIWSDKLLNLVLGHEEPK
jgi:hypothetical protein